MKNIVIIFVGISLMALGFILLPNTGAASEQDNNIAKVLLDNERVKVVENIRHPGALAPMHSHKAYIAYFFSACKIKVTTPDGKVVEKSIPAGKLVWSNGVTHEVEVLGNTDLHSLHIQFKD
ncbi:cupin domain-containing protein [Desulforhopalus singaporensis]|uniref:Cupin domain-containing protein n=1 Tax=Desulforhopalus singaporensis TaxID=91360 RepID=A0A1H0U667_9BACT|nr:hypothetical protein [Desulforhopalus singaporensis]SDP61326.1 hypothetical protein SAMN05660330_03382 [Desulforhopalus singaporensis]